MDIRHDPDLSLDPGELTAGADAVDTSAEDLRAHRDEIGCAVDGLLATWHGDAATAFAGLWEEWRAGADEVIGGLSASAAALRHARDQVVAADGDRADAHARLQGRLAIQDRLGLDDRAGRDGRLG